MGNLDYPNYLPSATAISRNGTCTAMYCHSDGTGHEAKTIATWGGTLPLDCTGCHGGNALTGVNFIQTGKHAEHINNATNASGTNLGTNYKCARCHNATMSVPDDLVVTNLSNHVNHAPEVAFNDGGSYNTGTCSYTLCHGAGKATAPQPTAAVTWSGGAMGCKDCHGANGGPGGFTSQYGEPNYQNAATVADVLATAARGP